MNKATLQPVEKEWDKKKIINEKCKKNSRYSITVKIGRTITLRVMYIVLLLFHEQNSREKRKYKKMSDVTSLEL